MLFSMRCASEFDFRGYSFDKCDDPRLDIETHAGKVECSCGKSGKYLMLPSLSLKVSFLFKQPFFHKCRCWLRKV